MNKKEIERRQIENKSFIRKDKAPLIYRTSRSCEEFLPLQLLLHPPPPLKSLNYLIFLKHLFKMMLRMMIERK